MDIVKISQGIATSNFVNKNASAVSDSIAQAAPKIASLNGLSALANQNMPAVKKIFQWDIPDDIFLRIKNVLLDWSDGNIIPDDKSIKFIASTFFDLKAENLEHQIYYYSGVFDKFSQLDKVAREKFINSNFIRYLSQSTDSKGFKFTSFNIPTNEIDELDTLVQDDFISHYFQSLVKRYSATEDNDIKRCLPIFKEKMEKLSQGFCRTKQAPLFYDLLKKRSYEDIDEISDTILACTKNSDGKDLDKLHSILGYLLSAQTPDGKFIFGTSEASDTTSKTMLSGIENILNAQKNNPKQYEQFIQLLELTKKGEIPSNVLGTLAKEGKINPALIEAIEDVSRRKSQILNFPDIKSAKIQSKLGDIVQVEGKLFYRNKDELSELAISCETFNELFPRVQTAALGQGQLGDCYLVSAIYDFLKNPNARGKIYQMFSQEGDDIIVTIPDAKEFPIKFSKKMLQKDGERNMNASLGVQMLEDAYSKTRALKYGTANKLTTIEGGQQMFVYNAFFGKNCSECYTTDIIEMRTIDEIEQRLKDLAVEIQTEKAKIKNLKDSNNLNEHCFYIFDQRQIKRVNSLEAEQRSLHERIETMSYIHNCSQEDLLQKLIDSATDDNLISIGAKEGSDFFDKDRLIHPLHAYSVLGVDKKNKTIDIVNPWNTAMHTTISFDEFKNWFDTVNIAKN